MKKIFFYISAENGGELAFKTFIGHGGSPFVMVLNRGNQYVDYSKEHKNQMRFRIRLSKNRLASGQLGYENQ